ncbi:MAG: thiolase family protein [Rhodobacteraceae bacterium]|nr:MAG: thiolase family protein [Paracoccaceae bacterium]
MSRIVAARRSAVAPRGGALAALDVHELAAPVLASALEDAGLGPGDVGEVIVSNALGAGGNPARRVALACGLPERVAGLSVDRQCAGGLDALLLGDALIRAGQHEVIVAGGVESYSRRPLRARTFADGRPPEPYDQAPFTPWPERDPEMAAAAEALGRSLGIDRAAQDHWAMESHRKALACPADVLAAEIVPVAGLARDAFSRALTPRLCARAPVVQGAITAANMAVAADGAAFVVMVSERLARELDRPAVRIAAGCTLGGAPDCPGLAPVAAIEAVLAGQTPSALTAAEVMEAFAVQALACVQGAGLAPEITNRFGGALARGHPVGASGTILAVRLYHLLSREGGLGLAAIAAAGGIGSAVLMQEG